MNLSTPFCKIYAKKIKTLLKAVAKIVFRLFKCYNKE